MNLSGIPSVKTYVSTCKRTIDGLIEKNDFKNAFYMITLVMSRLTGCTLDEFLKYYETVLDRKYIKFGNKLFKRGDFPFEFTSVCY
jgi:hypothetical protein